VKKKVTDPSRFRCPSKIENWCYEVVPATYKKGKFVVQVKGRSHIIMGYLGPGCFRSPNEVHAGRYWKSKKEADAAAQECIILNRRKKPR